MLRSVTNRGDTATPSRPPSPSGRTPGTCPSTLGVCPALTCRSWALSRRVTRAEPSGRKAMPHGTSRLVAMVDVAGTAGLVGAVVRVVVGVPLVVVDEPLDVEVAVLDGVSTGAETVAPWPGPSVPEHPPTSSAAATPVVAAAPAEVPNRRNGARGIPQLCATPIRSHPRWTGWRGPCASGLAWVA